MTAAPKPRKRVPPYGRELADARRQGLVPATPTGWFLVCLGWGVSRLVQSMDRWPRVVLPLDVAIQDYDLRPLAGLDLLLAYELRDAARVDEVAQSILAIRPRTLTAWGVPEGFFPGGNGKIVSHVWQGRGETLLPGVREPWA